MSFDILRMSLSQNKAFHCYLLLSIWILLLIGGVYKFLEPEQVLPEPIVTSEFFHNLPYDKTKKVFRICNFPKDITEGDEGILLTKKWLLKGLLILIRHGDRGPLQHVRNINSINCGTEQTDYLDSYKHYLHNLTISGKLSWIGPGPFHNFPILPTHPNQCQLGQLTMQGIQQLLKLGHILRESYRRVWQKGNNLLPQEILVYSTRYRRTFQSALAFLYSFIQPETLQKVSIYESQSINFCFKDCGCPIVDRLSKMVKSCLLKSHPAVQLLVDSSGKSLFSPGAEQGILRSDPHAIRDALLTYICHGSNLPCESSTNCIKRKKVSSIFTYTDWVNAQRWGNFYYKRLSLLKSYGLIRHIVQQMLHMMSNTGPFLVFYSGHDNTVEQLSSALGLRYDPALLRYGARIIFEVYQDNREQHVSAKGVYFRLLSNGRDVTKQVKFCKNLISIDNKVNLCKIEDIVRFLHDDYFSSLNVSNFKDACVVKTD